MGQRHTRESLIALGLGDQLPPRTLQSPVPLEEGEPHPFHAETGRAAQKLGADFEAMLEATHQAWELQGRAGITRKPVDHAPAPKRIRDPQGVFRPGTIRILAKRQGFDYEGVLGGHGRYHGTAFAMEAKASATRKTALRISEEGPIRAHQLQRLSIDHVRYGRMVAIVWMNGGDRLYLPPRGIVEAWAAYDNGGRKSIPLEAWKPYEARGGLEDYLTPLLENA